MAKRPHNPDPLKARDGGATLLEVLVVLAVLAMAGTMVLPAGSRMLERMTVHVVHFELQRDLSDLRRRAGAEQRAFRVVSSDAQARAETDVVLPLREPWSYRLDRPLQVSDGGACEAAKVELRRGDERPTTLRVEDANCRLKRLD